MWFAQLIFFLCLAAALLLPRRWALLSYLVLIQIDLSGGAFASASALGWGNTVKIVVVPTLLLWRCGLEIWPKEEWSWMARFWMLLVGYAAAATLWSPFRLSGVKMTAYLLAYAILYRVYRAAWENDWIHRQDLLIACWISLGIALLQTYALGNPFGVSEDQFTQRMTTYSAPFSYSGFLVAIFAVVYVSGDRSWRAILSMGAVVVGVVMTGSRYAFVGLLCVVLVQVAWNALRRSRSVFPALAKLALGAMTVILILVLVVHFTPENRLSELFQTDLTVEESLEDIGTLAFRVNMYLHTMQDLQDRGLRRLILGSGTSSGANVLLEMDSRYTDETIDANRVMHSDFLRAFYEWGLGGLALLAFVSALIIRCFRAAVAGSQSARILLVTLPTILMTLFIGNLLADAGGPAGTIFTVLTAAGLASAGVERASAAAGAGAAARSNIV